MKKIRLYLISGFLFTAVLGTLSHFFYEWSGGSALIGLVSPVSESTWEHMKLLFFPVLIWSFFLPLHLSDDYPALRPSLLLGGLLGTLSIPVLFYTYSGILGHNVTWIDIAIFFISVIIAYSCTWKLYGSDRIYQKRNLIYLAVLLFIILFFLFTYHPPDIGLFAKP
ncbi:MAG TPA: hypothetical protein H9722_11695 [Candidatus Mediterraneibacter pullistercoris]|nr:hypothetical protein [Candidatus Mediterraneibacter pullistercoris]